MKESINIIRVYNLVDPNGNKTQLRLGQYMCVESHYFRWSFVGNNIPIPVRSHTWFNGFPEKTMLDWLNGNGWYVRTRVDMHSGCVHVYELPKGNENPVVNEECPIPYPPDQPAFEEAVRHMYNHGMKATATRLYRYVHGGSLRNAYNAVREICGET